jgi:hypothetical protein
MNTIHDYIVALQTGHVEIEGVITAPVMMPASIDNADMPMVLVFPSVAVHQEPRIGGPGSERDYDVRVYVGPVASGLGVDERYQESVTLLQAFIEYYYQHKRVLSSVIMPNWTDSGIYPLNFGGVEWQGFELNITIKEATHGIPYHSSA